MEVNVLIYQFARLYCKLSLETGMASRFAFKQIMRPHLVTPAFIWHLNNFCIRGAWTEQTGLSGSEHSFTDIGVFLSPMWFSIFYFIFFFMESQELGTGFKIPKNSVTIWNKKWAIFEMTGRFSGQKLFLEIRILHCNQRRCISSSLVAWTPPTISDGISHHLSSQKKKKIKNFVLTSVLFSLLLLPGSNEKFDLCSNR